MTKNFIQSETLRALVFLSLLVAIAFLPVISNQQTLFSAMYGFPLESGPYQHQSLRIPWNADPTVYMGYEIPQTVYWAQQLQQGSFAFWNPYQGNGQPLSSSLASGAYQPLKLLLFFLFPQVKTFDYYLILRFLIAGFGTYLFLKKIALPHQSALLGSVAYMFSGYFVLWINHGNLASDMMFPYLLLGIEQLFTSPRWRYIFLLGLAWGIMVLGGNPEAVMVVSLFSAGYFIYVYWLRRPPAVVIPAFLMALVVALAISLPLLWDYVLFFSQGINAHARGLLVQAYDLYSPRQLLLRVFTLPISPLLFFEAANLGGLWKGDWAVPYIGIFITLLVAVAFSSPDDRKYRSLLFFFGGTLLFFILMWADLPPAIWIRKLPVVEKIILFKYNGPFYFALAVLAAIGFENLKQGDVKMKKFNRILLVAFIVLGGLWIFSSTFRGFYEFILTPVRLEKINAQLLALPYLIQSPLRWLISHPYSYAAVIFGLTGIFIILFLLLQRQGKHRLVFFFLILELLLYLPKLREGFSIGGFNPFREPPFIAYLKARPDIDHYRIFAVGRTLEPQIASVYGLKDLRTNEGVILRPYRQFIEPFFVSGYLKGSFPDWYTGSADQLNDRRFISLFDRAGVKYIISEKSLPADAPYRLVYDGEVKIYENAGALPLAYLEMEDGTVVRNVSLISRMANQVILRADVSRQAMLVLSETNYPGWQVFVDGEREEIVTVHGMFRGLSLPPGKHTVVFKYRPLFTKETLKAIVSAWHTI